jgi:hypothetical protein
MMIELTPTQERVIECQADGGVSKPTIRSPAAPPAALRTLRLTATPATDDAWDTMFVSAPPLRQSAPSRIIRRKGFDDPPRRKLLKLSALAIGVSLRPLFRRKAGSTLSTSRNAFR